MHISRRDIAEQLYRAISSNTNCATAYSQLNPDANLAMAYDLQAAVVGRFVANGDRLLGWKIALTNRAGQQRFGVNTPVFGPLLASTQYTGPVIAHPTPLAAHVEGELVLRLGEDCPPTCDNHAQLLDRISSVHLGFEIASRRIVGSAHIIDLIADHAAAAGTLVSPTAIAPDRVDFAHCAMQLVKPDNTVINGTSQDVLGHPLDSILWLIGQLAEQGKLLRRGDIIFSGAMVTAMNAGPGDRFELHFSSAGQVLDSLELQFKA